MTYLISRPTRREAEAQRQESLARRHFPASRYRGVARTAEEGFETQRALEREGETFDKLWVVSEDSPEAKIAHEDLMLKMGVNPETNETLHSPSTKHGR